MSSIILQGITLDELADALADAVAERVAKMQERPAIEEVVSRAGAIKMIEDAGYRGAKNRLAKIKKVRHGVYRKIDIINYLNGL